MPNVYPVCDGEIAIALGQDKPFQCYSDASHTVLGTWSFKPEPAISDLFSQLQMLNTFDSDQATKTISYCLLIFTLGFIVGVILRQLRRV